MGLAAGSFGNARLLRSLLAIETSTCRTRFVGMKKPRFLGGANYVFHVYRLLISPFYGDCWSTHKVPYWALGPVVVHSPNIGDGLKIANQPSLVKSYSQKY